jgi:hypothetical protein
MMKMEGSELEKVGDEGFCSLSYQCCRMWGRLPITWRRLLRTFAAPCDIDMETEHSELLIIFGKIRCILVLAVSSPDRCRGY